MNVPVPRAHALGWEYAALRALGASLLLGFPIWNAVRSESGRRPAFPNCDALRHEL